MVLNEGMDTFSNIPLNLSSSNTITEDFIIEKSGNTRLIITSVYTGSNADNIRYEFSINSIDNLQESYKNFYSKINKEIYVIDTVKYEDDVDKNEFTTHESYMLPQFWTPDDSTQSKDITKDFVPHTLYSRLNFAEAAKRKDPLSVTHPLNYTHTMNITREGGWDIQQEVREEDNKFFTYSFKREMTGDKVTLLYDYKSKTDVIMPDEYKAYRSKMDFINHNMVFTATQKSLTEGTIGFNWPLVLSILLGLATGLILVWKLAVAEFHPALTYENKYNSIGGWLILLAIGITLNPLKLLFTICKQYYTEMGVNYMVYFFDEHSAYFSPLQGYYNLLLPFLNVFFTMFSVFILILFYKRRRKFRSYFSIYIIGNIIFLIANLIVLHYLYSGTTVIENRTLLSTETSGTVRLLINGLIWVPYIWYSERSKHTFTTDRYTANDTTQDHTELPIE
jgi:hypothetical protein